MKTIDLFAQRGTMTARDVSPWQTFSGKGMRFRLQSYDWAGCACLSHLTMRAFGGLIIMETVICSPYAIDLPLFSYDGINVLGRKTVFLEFYDTQVAPADLSPLMAVKEKYATLKDKPLKPAWYDTLRLPPCTFKVGRDARLPQLVSDMSTAYLDLFATAREVDRQKKTAKTSAYVEALIANGGPAINAVRGMIGNEDAEEMFRRFLFGTK